MALAVIEADCAVVTDAALAVNEAAEAPPGTVMLAGTVSAPALLASATVCPPVGAAELSETEQEVDPAPVKEF